MSRKALDHLDARDLEVERLARAQVVAATATLDAFEVDVGKRAPGRKNTRRWCKGRPGREHTPEIAVPDNRLGLRDKCGWYDLRIGGLTTASYYCQHVERCAACGKVLRRHYGWLPGYKLLPGELAATDCPDYTPST